MTTKTTTQSSIRNGKSKPKNKNTKNVLRKRPAKMTEELMDQTTPAPTAESRSILSAAEQVLMRRKQPMGCKAMIEVILDEQLWSTKGKTPHATLYAAIHREIQKKGKASRFKKVERGMFSLA